MISDNINLPKKRFISPGKDSIYYAKLLTETSKDTTNFSGEKSNKIKQNSKRETLFNSNIDNMQTTEAICNIIDLINDNNLNLYYKDDKSNFKKNIDQLNLNFYLETEKIMSLNQNKVIGENNSINTSKLFLILFKQINLYIKEIERLNSLINDSANAADNVKKKTEIFLRKQNEFETKEQLIQTLKNSINNLEKKLSNVLISENNLRKELQKLQTEKNFYFEYYQASNKVNQATSRNDKPITENNLVPQEKRKNSQNQVIKRNNSEQELHKVNNIQSSSKAIPKRNGVKNISSKNGNNKSIIKLFNLYSNNIDINLPLGYKSKSPGKNNCKIQINEIANDKGKKSLKISSSINDNKNKINNYNGMNNSNFKIYNPVVRKTQTIVASRLKNNKELNIDNLLKKNNKKRKVNSFIIDNEVKDIKDADYFPDNLNELEKLLIDIKDYINDNKIFKNSNNNTLKNSKDCKKK